MKDQVAQIKERVDIVSIISEYLDLKKSGRNYKALCPFHSEKTPSFMVSQELQIFKCFGCGEGGDVFDFLQKYEGMEFYESLKFLADRVGIKLKPIKPGLRSEKERYYEINSLAQKLYSFLLLKHRIGRKALDYLLKERKIRMESIKTFGLGYSPENPFVLKKYLVYRKKIPQEDLLGVGLVFVKDKVVYDRFRGRIVFPLYDHRGNILGFAGRLLPSEKDKDLAKYINSPETPIYHKSNILYGLNVSKGNIKEKGFAVIVEGELDMISSWQAGVNNVVAIKGSALTQEQVKLLSRYTQSIVLALDSDIAGDKAARRGIQIAEKEGFEIKVAKLSGYKDPDDLAKENPEELIRCIKRAVGVWDFYLESAYERFGFTTGAQKLKLSRELIPVLASIGDKIVQAHYVQKFARKLNVSEEVVYRQIEEFEKEDKQKKPELEISKVTKEEKSPREKMEERLMALAFRFDLDLLKNRDIVDLVVTPLAKRILHAFRDFMKKRRLFDPSLFAENLPKELLEGFLGMVLKEVGGLEDKPESYQNEIRVIVKNLKVLEAKEKLRLVSLELKEAERKGDLKVLRDKQEEFSKVSNVLREIEAG